MTSASQAVNDSRSNHPAFEWVRSQTIDSLNITVEEYRHRKTGAAHYHMAANNDENVFLVALRTVPMDSRGVAHILEHTALCGSERYPVRDPFFMMIRRSLNTFMNAFTSSDWTAYPFASQNRKDFNNLLEVYLDAVFFSRLDEMDFAQEGHRVEFAETDNADSDLVYKGVVFNEMKGAMSSVPSTLWQTLCKHLYPTTTYHYNSGGDPVDIPDLSYQQLLDFYRTHYHPSNAIFMTYGNISAEEHHASFEERALSRFEKLDINIHVPEEKRYSAPVAAKEHYAFDEEGSSDNKNHVVMGWLWGQSANLQDLLQGQLLSSVLLDNSNSPLQRALETTELANSPSPLCGLEDSMRELTFVCGVEGAQAADVDNIEAMILSTIQDVADNGVPQQQVDAVLHQLELHQREVGGDGYPFGLQLILAAIGNATHRGDPIAVLNLDPVLEQLREDIKDPEFIKGLAKKLLIDNPHRVTLTMAPDSELSAQRDQAEAAKLAEIKAALTEQEKQQIIDQAHALNERQRQKDDESILPKVGLEDVPPTIRQVTGDTATLGGMPTHSFSQGTNGLVYQQVLIELPALSDELTALLPYYTSALTEIGIGDKDYLATQAWQANICGSINAFTTMRGAIDNEQAVSSYLILSSKALSRNQQQQAQLMQQTLQDARFDELPRLRELVGQQRARREQSVTNNGHSLAMTAASSGMSPVAQLSHQLSGLAGIQAVKQLDDSLQNEAGLQAYADKLQELHQLILAAPKQCLLVAEADKLAQCQQSISTLWADTPVATKTSPFKPDTIRQINKQLWIANTQVNFCAKAYPTVTSEHPDAAALTVLGGFLRNGYLHRAIREQGGAYGGGASQDSNTASFRFYSYRDPRLEETLQDFDGAVNWLLETEHDPEQLEQAILGVISSLDKPGSPAGEAKQSFHNNLFGRSHAQRSGFRQRVLEVSLDDLKRVTSRYLTPESASLAVVTNQSNAEPLGDFVKINAIETQTV
ncbi:insulinase family protein [Oceanicoccus sagamiensis]|uniref:Peptidase M16 n=1 Tax=Oceanicoccus sagamiensis TaxID=716816 RepID=A0A1X9NIK3_9GAMM|nr:insulinase family protein [Oceanicoccus sagamiensis]ARN76212.1 peptidase M16 [Oceanicoccus sagamiensis]